MEGSATTKWLGGVLVHAVVTPGVALFSNDLPPPSLEDLRAADRASTCSSSTRRPARR